MSRSGSNAAFLYTTCAGILCVEKRQARWFSGPFLFLVFVVVMVYSAVVLIKENICNYKMKAHTTGDPQIRFGLSEE